MRLTEQLLDDGLDREKEREGERERERERQRERETDRPKTLNATVLEDYFSQPHLHKKHPTRRMGLQKSRTKPPKNHTLAFTSPLGRQKREDRLVGGRGNGKPEPEATW